MTERIFKIISGSVLLIAGAGIIYAFQMQDWHKNHDVWDAGFLLIAEAYSAVGSLFILLGLRYIFGSHSFIEQKISRALRHFWLTVILLSFGILAAMIFAKLF